VLHILNMPASLLFFPGGYRPAPPTLPEDFTPTAPISIELPGEWISASSPLHPERVTAERCEGGLQITLERLERHEILEVIQASG
jgi:hypothetical protein